MEELLTLGGHPSFKQTKNSRWGELIFEYVKDKKVQDAI